MDNGCRSSRSRSKERNTWWVAIPFLIVGGVLFLDKIGFYFPDWIFQWEMILILVGLFIGLKDGFRNRTWLLLVGIGAFFLADDILPRLDLGRFILPVIFLGIGLLILSRSKPIKQNIDPVPPVPTDNNDDFGVRADTGETFKDSTSEEKTWTAPDINATENSIEVASIFGNVRKNIMSKNFKGGQILTVFGGADINLMHADFNKKVVVEAVNLFGGTKLIIPSSWEIKSEVVSIFGGIEDKRQFSTLSVVPEKTLVLQGFCMFGGIEIKSFNR